MTQAWVAVATQASGSEEGGADEEAEVEVEVEDDDEAAESALAVLMQAVVGLRFVEFVVSASAGNSLLIQPQGQKGSSSEDQSSSGLGRGSVAKSCSSVAGEDDIALIVVCVEGVAAKADVKSTSI